MNTALFAAANTLNTINILNLFNMQQCRRRKEDQRRRIKLEEEYQHLKKQNERK